MSMNPRRRFMLSLIIPFTLGACARHSESEQIARKFITAYYVEIDLPKAKGLTSGLAEQKINQQIALLETSSPDPKIEKPKVDYRLISNNQISANEASYVFEVDPHVRDVGTKKVFLKLRRGEDDGKWQVSHFEEESGQ